MLRNFIKRLQNNFTVNFFENKYLFSLIFYFTFKTVFAYQTEFTLGISSNFQWVISFLSLISISLLLYGIASIPKNYYLRSVCMFLVSVFLSALLLSNIYYFREFSDFLTWDVIIKSSSSSKGLLKVLTNFTKPVDILYALDSIVLLITFFLPKKDKVFSNKYRFKILLGTALSFFTIFLANIDRPQLLTRSFDNNYLVKYLGLSGFTMKNVYDYNSLQMQRAEASENDLEEVEQKLLKDHKENKYTGIAEGKNIVYIHLESMQQFLINYSLVIDGKEYEVTPNINKIFNSTDTLSFENAFHQTKQGKTSDAEFMIENSFFGVNEGSAMVKYGTNKYFSAPKIFKNLGYTSQVFHGNVETFWNRRIAYDSFGYDKFYSLKDFDNQEVINYGIKDDVFFQESVEKYLKIDGLKYSKFIPVSHHFPYDTSALGSDFPLAETDDETINGYFATANYMDKQIGEFLKRLEETGELNNTIFVLYGDHYGISNYRNLELNKVLNLTDNWNNYHNAMMQRVPLMFYIPDSNVNPNAEINSSYVGQIDILPTLLNLMNVDQSIYLMLGQDVFSDSYDNIVEFRDGGFITPTFLYYKDKAYISTTGERIPKDDFEVYPDLLNAISYTKERLDISDKIVIGNLLQFKTLEYSKKD